MVGTAASAFEIESKKDEDESIGFANILKKGSNMAASFLKGITMSFKRLPFGHQSNDAKEASGPRRV